MAFFSVCLYWVSPGLAFLFMGSDPSPAMPEYEQPFTGFTDPRLKNPVISFVRMFEPGIAQFEDTSFVVQCISIDAKDRDAFLRFRWPHERSDAAQLPEIIDPQNVVRGDFQDRFAWSMRLPARGQSDSKLQIRMIDQESKAGQDVKVKILTPTAQKISTNRIPGGSLFESEIVFGHFDSVHGEIDAMAIRTKLPLDEIRRCWTKDQFDSQEIDSDLQYYRLTRSSESWGVWFNRETERSILIFVRRS